MTASHLFLCFCMGFIYQTFGEEIERPLSTFRILTQTYQDHVVSRSLSTLNYTNPFDTFVPSSAMKMVLTITNQPFPSSTASAMTFLLGLVIIPAALFILGILSLFFLNCGLLFRCCCFCCKCLPQFTGEARNEERVKVLKFHRRTTLSFFFLFCLLTLLADQLSFIGNVSITSGKITVEHMRKYSTEHAFVRTTILFYVRRLYVCGGLTNFAY